MSNNWEFDYSELYKQQNTPAPEPEQVPVVDPTFSQPQPVQELPQTPPPYVPPVQPTFTQPQPEKPKKVKKHSGTAKRVLAATLALAVVGSVGFGGGYLGSMVANQNQKTVIVQEQTQPATSTATPTIATPEGDLTIMDIAAIAGPSVVEVTTEAATTNPLQYGSYVVSGAGSGVIISADGYMITNNHVVEGASQIKVMLADKTEYVATLVGTDAKTDIAVLKVEATDLPAVTIGNSDTLKVGEFTLAVGNPLGTLGGTVTDGIVSALNRDITIENETMTLLQTNAAVSPGNSGGGLFNARGELIGIVNAKSGEEDSEGLGFAIPVNTAMSVANDLIENGFVTGRPVMGVTVITVMDAQTAMQYGVDSFGVYIYDVTKDGAADKAGLQAGDMIVSMADTVVTSTTDVTDVIAQHKVGDVLTMQIARDRKVKTVEITLQEQTTAPVTPSVPEFEQQPEQPQEMPEQNGNQMPDWRDFFPFG